jgi:hypothetical protein
LGKEDDPIDDWTKDLANLAKRGDRNEIPKKGKDPERKDGLQVQATRGSS